MIILAQASDGSTWIFLALGIAIGLVALAAWATHWIWFFRSFGLFRVLVSFGKDNVARNIIRKNWLHYFLGAMGLAVPIVGIIHGFAIWAGAGLRVGELQEH
jgi:hypothetical protein